MGKIKFKHISAGQDGTTWTVGKADGTIYRLFGDAGYVGWVPDKVGKAEVVAGVNWGNALVCQQRPRDMATDGCGKSGHRRHLDADSDA